MIVISGTCWDQTVTGTELDVGVWRVSDEQFADYMKATPTPDGFLILGGTLSVDADFRSHEAWVRAETFKWFVERFLRLTFPNERVTWEGSGFTYPEFDGPEGVDEPVF